MQIKHNQKPTIALNNFKNIKLLLLSPNDLNKYKIVIPKTLFDAFIATIYIKLAANATC